MVQNKEVEEQVLTNGEIKTEANIEQCENGKLYESETNGHISEEEDSDDDDYLDHLLMLPQLDANSCDRNKSFFVRQCLLDFCTAIESRKEYQKIKQELLDNSAPPEIKQEAAEQEAVAPVLETNLNGNEESPQPETEPKAIEVTIEVNLDEEVIETRRQSIRLNKAKFGKLGKLISIARLLIPFLTVPEHEPSINDQFFVCRRCTIFFRTRKLCKEHNLQHHRRKAPTAPAIGDDKLKQRQRRSSSNKDPFICDLCQKLFKQKALLRSHMNTHLTEPQFFCTVCPYASKRNNDLKKHLAMHHNPDRIVKQRMRKRKCDECEEVLSGKKAFKLHMKEKHLPMKKCRVSRRACEKCEEVLEGVKAYRLHMKQKHSEANNIRCETCHRKFKTNFRLKKHQIKFGE